MPSFDIVSKIDLQEVDNAINIARKELANRFDFKGSKAEIQFENDAITLSAENDFKLKQLKDILESKMAKRGISPLSLDYQKMEDATLGSVRQKVLLKQGVSKEKGKQLTKTIKQSKLKVQAQLQDDKVRVTGKKIDDLQAVIQMMKTMVQEKQFDQPLQFENMRS